MGRLHGSVSLLGSWAAQYFPQGAWVGLVLPRPSPPPPRGESQVQVSLLLIGSCESGMTLGMLMSASAWASTLGSRLLGLCLLPLWWKGWATSTGKLQDLIPVPYGPSQLHKELLFKFQFSWWMRWLFELCVLCQDDSYIIC